MPFPFLCLPADLRLEIYHICLGGHTIHVGWPERRTNGLRTRLCQAARPEEDVYVESEPRHFMIDRDDEARHRHALCHKGRWTPSAAPAPAPARILSLLLTCKDIHAEAWPTVWRENTFAFAERSDMHTFFSSLNTEQKNNMHHIQLPDVSPLAEWSPHRMDGTYHPSLHSLRTFLTNLRALDVFCEVSWGEVEKSSFRPEARLARLKALGACPKLQRVRVWCVGQKPPAQRHGLSSPTGGAPIVSTRPMVDWVAVEQKLRGCEQRIEAGIWEVARRARRAGEQVGSEVDV